MFFFFKYYFFIFYFSVVLLFFFYIFSFCIPLDNYALFTKVNCRRATALFDKDHAHCRRMAINNIIDSVRWQKFSVLWLAAGGGNGGQEDEPQRHFEMLMKLPFKAEAAEWKPRSYSENVQAGKSWSSSGGFFFFDFFLPALLNW